MVCHESVLRHATRSQDASIFVFQETLPKAGKQRFAGRYTTMGLNASHYVSDFHQEDCKEQNPEQALENGLVLHNPLPGNQKQQHYSSGNPAVRAPSIVNQTMKKIRDIPAMLLTM